MESQPSEAEQLRKQLEELKLERDEAHKRIEKLQAENQALQRGVSFPKSGKEKFSSRVIIKSLLREGKPAIDREVVICGWAKTIRTQGGGRFAFVDLNDGSTLKGIQVVVTAETPGFADVTGTNSGTGACLLITGKVVASPGKEQDIEVAATEAVLLGQCVPGDYPISKNGIPLEVLREQAHLRARTNTFGAMARVRNACTMATHKFFQEQGFVNLHTPLITASDCEGAGEMFQVTTLLKNGSAKVADVPLIKETGKPDYSQDFFKKPAFLTVSGQLNGEMYACALGKIYTFGPTFRAEDSHTTRHLAEFWMIEPEVAFADLDDNMDLAEAYLKFVVQFVLDNCMEDLIFFDKFVDKKKLIERLRKVLEEPFARMSYTEAVDCLLKVDPKKKKFEIPVVWGMDLKSEHEQYIAEVVHKRPTILFNYPKDIKAFYMRLNEDGKTVRAMDVLVPGIGELMGGSQREERLEVLEAKIKECNLDREAYKYYLDLRRFGSCPHSGFGLGFERLVRYVTGIENIRDSIPFPRYPGHADF